MSNAIKYNEKGGKVMVSFGEIDDYLEIYFSDTGVGMYAEDIKRVFEKNYRAKGAEIIGGTGFGLYFVKLLMGAMEGEISATSQIGKGSVFTLKLRKGHKKPAIH